MIFINGRKSGADFGKPPFAKGRSGLERAFRSVFRQSCLCLFTVYLDKEDVHDVLQNGFILMFRSIASFEYRGKGSLKAWITKIVVNESLKHIRKNPDFKVVIEDFEVADEQPDENPDFKEISHQVIVDMIRSLPEGYRTVFNLFVFEEKSHKEIAEILGIAENSSTSQFHRAKLMLARKIKEYKMSKAMPYER